jgi:hypothetical protein
LQKRGNVLDQMTLTIGQLTANVAILTKGVDKLNAYLEEHGAVLDDHEKRVMRLEDCQARGNDNWKQATGFLLGVLGVIVAAWIKVRLGL